MRTKQKKSVRLSAMNYFRVRTSDVVKSRVVRRKSDQHKNSSRVVNSKSEWNRIMNQVVKGAGTTSLADFYGECFSIRF